MILELMATSSSEGEKWSTANLTLHFVLMRSGHVQFLFFCRCEIGETAYALMHQAPIRPYTEHIQSHFNELERGIWMNRVLPWNNLCLYNRSDDVKFLLHRLHPNGLFSWTFRLFSGILTLVFSSPISTRRLFSALLCTLLWELKFFTDRKYLLQILHVSLSMCVSILCADLAAGDLK